MRSLAAVLVGCLIRFSGLCVFLVFGVCVCFCADFCGLGVSGVSLVSNCFGLLGLLPEVLFLGGAGVCILGLVWLVC